MGAKSAYLSVDVDSVSSHLRGYGEHEIPEDGKVYDIGVPRILDIFSYHNVRATFFLIAGEALKHRSAVREIINRGHEVACHSYSHAVPLSLGNRKVRQQELTVSKQCLEDLTGKEVNGFRAPSWGLDDYLSSHLLEAGYLYDASLYPSWLILLMRMMVRKRGAKTISRASMGDALRAFASPHPFVLGVGTRKLVEIPVSTMPMLRIPFYHTIRFFFPATLMKLVARSMHLRKSPTTYIFHAVDFMGLREDDLDIRVRVHPGMLLTLAQKSSLIDRALLDLGVPEVGILPLNRLAAATLSATQ